MKSLDDLKKMKEEAQKMLRWREESKGVKVTVAMGTCGIAAGAREVVAAILDEIEKRNLEDVVLTQTSCLGLCDQEPIVIVEVPGQDKVTYGRINPQKAREIVSSHVVNNNIISEWVISTK